MQTRNLLQETTDMEEDIFYLRLRTFKALCILITGLDKLHISKSMKHYRNDKSYIDIIHALFKLLNIPISWIFFLKILFGGFFQDKIYDI